MPAPRPATTILLLREAAHGFEVFLVQRHRRAGFMPNAWVFPGGRVDDRDQLVHHPAVRGGDAVLAQMDLSPEQGVPFLVAGIRETFEEAGVWLGEGSLPEEARAPLARGEIGLEDLLERHRATLDLDRVRAWSWWVTPKAEPKRFDTRFLVALVDGQVGRHDETETVASGWFRPAELVETPLDRFPLAPPTWWVLRELAVHRSAAEAFHEAASRPQPEVQPVLRLAGEDLELLLPGHPDHPQPAVQGLPTRVILEGGRWVAFHGDQRLPSLP